MVSFAGWRMPIQYRGIHAEHEAVRLRAGLFDVCHMGELRLSGPGSLATADRLITNSLGPMSDGRAVYSCCCNSKGGVLDDVIAYRLEAEQVLVVCNAANRDKLAAHFANEAAGECEFRDVSDETGLLALQGPRAFDVLRRAGFAASKDGLRRFASVSATLAGVATMVARTGYTGEDGVELFCALQEIEALWSGLLEAGKSCGLEPVGLGARDTLRLEAALPLYGHELTEETSPLEAGLHWTVKFSKTDFVGRRALIRQKEAGLVRRLVGFEMVGRGIARHGYPLLDPGGAPQGVCTSGGPSITAKTAIGLGYLPTAMTEPGTPILVDCRGRLVEAVVRSTPFYRRSTRS
jgi:aminomethyltransferase